MFQNYDIYNAFMFFLIFLVLFEALAFAVGGQNPDNVEPQLLLVLISLFFGLVAGFKTKTSAGPWR